MPPQGAAYHIDWIFSNNSNVHVANHRDWFVTFTDHNTQFTPGFVIPTEAQVEVLGIGDVELDVKTHESRKGRKSHRKIILKDVLFAPKCITNILGGPILSDYDWAMGPGGGLKDRRTGGSAGLFDHAKLSKLWLVGQRKGMTSLDPKQMYCIHAIWSDLEREKWTMQKLLRDSANMVTSKQFTESNDPPYSMAEKAWLKRTYGGEYKLLLSYGLSIYKEEDRAEGRSIARALMQSDAESDDDVEDSESDRGEEEEQNDFLAELERDPTAHFADHVFSKIELDWVDKNFGNSGNFLVSQGLKYYDDEDCKEGVAIVKRLMSRKMAKPGPRFSSGMVAMSGVSGYTVSLNDVGSNLP